MNDFKPVLQRNGKMCSFSLQFLYIEVNKIIVPLCQADLERLCDLPYIDRFGTLRVVLVHLFYQVVLGFRGNLYLPFDRLPSAEAPALKLSLLSEKRLTYIQC